MSLPNSRHPRAAAATVVLAGLLLAAGNAGTASAAHGDARSPRPDGRGTAVVAGLRDMTVSPGSAGWAFTGSAGRVLDKQTKGLGLWRDGAATAELDVPARVAGEAGAQLSVTAGADVCNGPAHMTVTVDGVEVAQRQVDADLAVYPLPGSLAAGPHHVTVGYDGDVITADCDRSLKLYAVTASRADVAPAPSLSFGPPSLLLSDPAVGYWRDLKHGAETVLYAPGSASRTFTSPGSDAATVVVSAAGVDCDGPATFETYLDGADLGRTDTTDTPTAYRLPAGAVSAGSHELRVAFVNDSRTDACDRDLHLRSVAVVG